MCKHSKVTLCPYELASVVTPQKREMGGYVWYIGAWHTLYRTQWQSLWQNGKIIILNYFLSCLTYHSLTHVCTCTKMHVPEGPVGHGRQRRTPVKSSLYILGFFWLVMTNWVWTGLLHALGISSFNEVKLLLQKLACFSLQEFQTRLLSIVFINFGYLNGYKSASLIDNKKRNNKCGVL